jgi:hypothetical protein
MCVVYFSSVFTFPIFPPQTVCYSFKFIGYSVDKSFSFVLNQKLKCNATEISVYAIKVCKLEQTSYLSM